MTRSAAFEWDENKRLKNIQKHALDFLDADLLFEAPHLVASTDAERWLATGMINNVCVTIIFTMRGDVIRIISMRRARDGERRKYTALFAG